MAGSATQGVEEFRTEIQKAIAIVQAALITEDTREVAILTRNLLQFMRDLLGIATGPEPSDPGF